MVAGHTKFATDQMFSVLACVYNASDIFNEEQKSLANMLLWLSTTER